MTYQRSWYRRAISTKWLRPGSSRCGATMNITGDIRGTGFFLAVELVMDRETRNPDKSRTHRIVNDLRENGVLTGSIGPDNNILKLRPPMVLSAADANFLIETLDGSLSRTATQKTNS